MSQRHFHSRRPLHLATTPAGKKVTLAQGERSTHLHVLGASGSGKSRFLEHLIMQDIRAERGVCVLDPHGTLYDRLARRLSSDRIDPERVHLFQPANQDWTFGFNPLGFGAENQARREFSVKATTRAIGQVWGGPDFSQTPRLRRRLLAVIGALADLNLPLPEAKQLLVAVDPTGRRSELIARIRNPVLRKEWEEVERYRPRDFNEQFESTINRLGEFINSAIIARMLAQSERAIDFAGIMDRSEVLLVDLSSHGATFSGSDSEMLGRLLVNDLYLKCKDRTPDDPPFYLYIDECHLYLNSDIEDILFQARKWGLHLVLAHQDLSQLKKAGDSVYGAVMSAAQTKIVFQMGSMEDAKTLAFERMHGEVDYEKLKGITRKEVVGHRIRRFKNGSTSETQGETRGEAETRSSSSGLTITTSAGASTSEGGSVSDGGSETFDHETGELLHRSDNSTASESWQHSELWGSSTVESEGYAESEQINRSSTATTGQSEGYSESLEPILADVQQQTYTLEEIVHSQSRELASLSQRHALVMRKPKDGRVLIERIKTPLVRDISPERTQEDLEDFEVAALKTSGHAVEIRELEEAPVPPPLAQQQEPEDW